MAVEFLVLRVRSEVGHDSGFGFVDLVDGELSGDGTTEEVDLTDDFVALDRRHRDLLTDESTADHIQDVPYIIVHLDVLFNLGVG